MDMQWQDENEQPQDKQNDSSQNANQLNNKRHDVSNKNNKQITDDEKKKRRKKIIRNILITVVIMIIIIITAVIIYRIMANRANEQIREEMKNGVIVEKRENVETDIKVTPESIIYDKDGKAVPAGYKIENNTDINLSDNAIKAIEIEHGEIPGVTVDGQAVKGGVNIENGMATYYDKNGNYHKTSIEGLDIKINNKPLDNNIIKEMNNINYKDNGNIVFSELDTHIKFDGRDMTTSYIDGNGLTYGTTKIPNVTEKNGSFYSSHDGINFKELNPQHQKNLNTLKEYIGNKWLFAQNEKIQDIFPVNVEQYNLPSKTNLYATTNLKNVANINYRIS